MMLAIPDILTAAEAAQCRAALEQADWLDGRQTAGGVAVQAKSNHQLRADDPLAVRLGDFILGCLGRSDRFTAAAVPLKVLPPLFNRYAGGGAYGDHIDRAVFNVPGTPHRIRSDLSATLFLTPPEDYDGGELLIRGEYGQHRIKLPAGHLFLYPGNTLHQVAPVTRGARLAAVFWTQSLVRSQERRTMLLDLDESIRGLRSSVPDSPEIVRLTGLYHNLLRDWAET